MEVHETPPPSDSSLAAVYPRWVMLEYFCTNKIDSTADANTLAASRNTTGHPIHVALRLAAPPSSSSVCLPNPDGIVNLYSQGIVIAADGDSVLIKVVLNVRHHRRHRPTAEYFIYKAGATTAEPMRPAPSLSLLPPAETVEDEFCGIWSRYNVGLHDLYDEATGLARRGDDEFVVAELKLVEVGCEDGGFMAKHKMAEVSLDTPTPKEAQLLILRSGKWSVRRPTITHTEDEGGELLLSSWRTHYVFPVGDGQLCWVDLSQGHGLLFCDVFDDHPVLRYVPLPAAAEEPLSGPESYASEVRATAGGTVRFVNVLPRCCCGGAGASHCRRSHHAYTINTWTLRMADMAWEMDGMVDATELWALDAYEGLPRVPPIFPIVVSMVEPHVICFTLCEQRHVPGGDGRAWLVMVDMRSKKIRSVSPYPEGRCYGKLVPSRVSDFFNPYPCHATPAASKSRKDIDKPPIVPPAVNNDADILVLQSSCFESPINPIRDESKVTSHEEMIFLELEKVPNLPRDEMLKAYSILSMDNGRRFRSLLGLPLSLRKEWLQMEIKASETACSICSACTAHLRCA